MLDRIMEQARKLHPDLPTTIVSPSPMSALSVIPADIREIGAKRLLGYKLTEADKDRLSDYVNSGRFEVGMFQKFVQKNK